MKHFIYAILLLVSSSAHAQIKKEVIRPGIKILCEPMAFFKQYVTDDPQKGTAAGPSTVEITVVNPVSSTWNVFYTGNNTTNQGYITNYKTVMTKDGTFLIWQADMLISDRFERMDKVNNPFPVNKATQPFSEQKSLPAKITLNTCTGDVEITGQVIGTKRYHCTVSPSNILYGWGNDGSLLAITFGTPIYTHPIN